MAAAPRCDVLNAGVLEYERAWDLQKALAWQVHEGTRPNTLLLLQHPPVYTIGRRGKREHVLLDDGELSTLGISVLDVDRGGQVTYHGPGQLVAYPVLDLRDWGGPVKYVRTLERVVIETLSGFGIAAGTLEGLTGVWVGDEMGSPERSRKIASIGVKISRGVAYHGFALNVSTDLSFFQHIVPCGIADGEVTSMEKLLGEQVDVDAVAYVLMYRFGIEMGFRMVQVEALPENVAFSETLAGVARPPAG